jgi:prefoldin subunit 5
MTTQQLEEMTSLDQTCAEIRQENAELRQTIAEMRNTLELIYKANSLGKTTKIADMIYPYFKR